MLRPCSLGIQTKKQSETDFHFYEIMMEVLFSGQNDAYAKIKTWKRCRSMYVWSYVERYFHQRPEKQPLNLWNYSNYDTSVLALDSFDGTDRYWLSSIILLIQYSNFLFYYLFFPLSICSLQKQANTSSKTTLTQHRITAVVNRFQWGKMNFILFVINSWLLVTLLQRTLLFDDCF